MADTAGPSNDITAPPLSRGRYCPQAVPKSLEDPVMLRSLPLLLVYSLVTATPVVAVLSTRVDTVAPTRMVAQEPPVERIVVTCKRDAAGVKPG
jgi:hypothetical protein